METIYGDANKQQRAATLARFREGKCQLLIATDVAARGLDIPGLPLVINLEPAADADQYVHRAGRTGRMGLAGTVVTIVAPGERYLIDKYKRKLGVEIPEKAMYKGKLSDPGDVPRRPAQSGSGKGGAPREAAAPAGRSGVSRTPKLDALLERKDDRVRTAGAPSEGVAASRGAAAPAFSQRQGAVRQPETAKTVKTSGDARPGVAGKQAAAGKAAGTVRPSRPAKPKKDKNKGAPKWLKEKETGRTRRKY